MWYLLDFYQCEFPTLEENTIQLLQPQYFIVIIEFINLLCALFKNGTMPRQYIEIYIRKATNT